MEYILEVDEDGDVRLYGADGRTLATDSHMAILMLADAVDPYNSTRLRLTVEAAE